MREYHVRFRERFGVKFPLSTRPKWNCKYHLVFAPKFRRKVIYGKLKADIAKILSTCAYVSGNPTKHKCIKFCRVSKREKYTYDIRKTCKFEVQIWEQTFLVQRVLCGYSRQECEKDTRVYPKSIKRRFGIRPNDTKGVY